MIANENSEKTIAGYKWVGAGLMTRGHQWTVGKWFANPVNVAGCTGAIGPCYRGFHASTRLVDALEWCGNGTRLFIVEARGEIVHGYNKFAASEMRLVAEVKNVPLIFSRFARLCARRAAMHARGALAMRVMLDVSEAARAARVARDAARRGGRPSRAPSPRTRR